MGLRSDRRFASRFPATLAPDAAPVRRYETPGGRDGNPDVVDGFTAVATALSSANPHSRRTSPRSIRKIALTRIRTPSRARLSLDTSRRLGRPPTVPDARQWPLHRRKSRHVRIFGVMAADRFGKAKPGRFGITVVGLLSRGRSGDRLESGSREDRPRTATDGTRLSIFWTYPSREFVLPGRFLSLEGLFPAGSRYRCSAPSQFFHDPAADRRFPVSPVVSFINATNRTYLILPTRN